MGAHGQSMLARDSSGKRISLLNNDPSPSYATNQDNTFYNEQSQGMARSSSNNSKTSSSPPSLVREASYDSRQDHPITPPSEHLRSPFTQTHSPPAFFTYPPLPPHESPPDAQYPLSPLSNASSQYPPSSFQTPASPQSSSAGGSTTAYQTAQPGAGAPQKKYECKYRIQHNCDQTFTTSGHASRHSKIHDSLKGIACTHPGCPKKFTRSDNMKQHLETHNKDKKREKGKNLTRAAGVQRMARPSSRASNGSIDLSQRTKEMYLYHAVEELEENQSDSFHTSPTSPTGTALDVLAAAADREMQTDTISHR